MVVLITGAAGNLGSLLARHLVPLGHELRLMYHRTPLPADLVATSNVRPIKADLADPDTVKPAVAGAPAGDQHALCLSVSVSGGGAEKASYVDSGPR